MHTITHSLSHAHTIALTRTRTHTHTHTHTHTRTHTHTHAHTHAPHTHTHTHTHTHAHTHTRRTHTHTGLFGDTSYVEISFPRTDSHADLPVPESTSNVPRVPSPVGGPTVLPTAAQPPVCPFHAGHGGRKSCTTGQVMTGDHDALSAVEERNEEESEHGQDSRSPVDLSQQEQQELRQLRAMLSHFPSATSLHRNLTPSILPNLPSRMNSRRGSAFASLMDYEWPITAHLFKNCFPFHMIFDRDLTIRHMGISLFRLFPRAIALEGKLTDYFELSRPSVKLTYANIRNSIHNVFVLTNRRPPATAKKGTTETIQFRGQMIPTSSGRDAPILYLASPRIHNVEELEQQGLYLSDIPIHDVTRDLILLNRHFQVEMKIALELETTQRNLQLQKEQVQKEKERADRLLHSMLPPSVALELKTGTTAGATEYPMVTILFSDVRDFTTICSKCQAMDVVGMLNRLYTRFDNLLDTHNVYKVSESY